MCITIKMKQTNKRVSETAYPNQITFREVFIKISNSTEEVDACTGIGSFFVDHI